MLINAGLKFDCCPANIDERSLENELLKKQSSPEKVAIDLAEQKARYISKEYPNSYILGADQTMSFQENGKIVRLHKVQDISEARKQLMTLMNKRHHLHCAVCCVKNGKILFSHYDRATLKMRNFTSHFLDDYIEKGGSKILSSVGCYQLEDVGIQLFEEIDGNYFTILGLPLLPLLGFLQKENILIQ